MKKISKECLICKEYFDKPKNCSLKEWIGSKKYCSKKCYSQAQKLGLHKNALGYKHTEETKKHLSEIHTGKKAPWTRERLLGKPPIYTPFILGCKPWNKGIKYLQITGDRHPNWKGGCKNRDRGTFEYKFWKNECFERDNYTCQICNKRGGYLEVHHIKSWKDYPELRYDVNNGQTLCKTCHGVVDNFRFTLLNKKEKKLCQTRR